MPRYTYMTLVSDKPSISTHREMTDERLNQFTRRGWKVSSVNWAVKDSGFPYMLSVLLEAEVEEVQE